MRPFDIQTEPSNLPEIQQLLKQRISPRDSTAPLIHVGWYTIGLVDNIHQTVDIEGLELG